MLRCRDRIPTCFAPKPRRGRSYRLLADEAVKIARANPERKVVFLAIGFETTAPPTPWPRGKPSARPRQLSMLVSHVLVPRPFVPDGFEQQPGAGFHCTGTCLHRDGCKEYESLVHDFRVPIVVGGFEPVDILEAVLMLVRQLEADEAKLENQYVRSVSYQGNIPAQEIMAEVFEIADQKWRGIGPIPQSVCV